MPSTTERPPPSFDVGDVIDRQVRVARVILARADGSLLATATDVDGSGCEGTAPHFYVTVTDDGELIEATDGSGLLYAGFPTASPGRTQVLDVAGCEGFLGAVTIYPVEDDLTLGQPIPVDIEGAVSGDASWTSDGFVSLYLTDGSPFLDPDDDSITVAEYLVNPRTGERTQSAELDQLRWGAVRLADGRLIYNGASETGAVVVVEQRDGSTEASYAAAGFAISPDVSSMLVWDSVFDTSADISVDLVDLETGEVRQIAAGSAYGAVWSRNGERVAFSNGLETYVHDLPSGDMITVGAGRPEGCEEDEWVVWGRVPLAFAPSGDLYVGDAVCGESTEGFPYDEFAVYQVTFVEPPG